MSEFISPNFHPLLVHYPIGLVITGVSIEVFSFLGWRSHPLRAAGRWMILLGVLASVVAVTSGIYALSSVARAGVPERQAFGTWNDLRQSSPLIQNSVAWQLMVRHLQLESAATGIMLLTTISWIAFSDRLRRKLGALCTIFVLAGVALMGSGAYLSGEAIYRRGVSVDPATTASVERGIDYYLPPVEAHTIGAGAAVALAALSIGLAIRARVVISTAQGMHEIAAALGGVPADFPHDNVERPSFVPSAIVQRVPSSRFALLTAVVALFTAAGGWWVLARDSSASVLAVRNLWELICDRNQNDGAWLTRRLAHVICGIAIIVLPILLAVVSRFLSRSRVILAALMVLLVLAIAGQFWLGVLLITDDSAGPVTHFAQAEASR